MHDKRRREISLSANAQSGVNNVRVDLGLDNQWEFVLIV